MKYGQLVAVSLASLFFMGACSRNRDEAQSFYEERISCPPPAVAEYEGWGKSGKQHVCKIKHGPVVFWDEGFVRIRGQYFNGNETGTWTWYDKDGNVVKTEERPQVDPQPVTR